jgi:hypothetical protein
VTGKIQATHAALLGIILAVSAFITQSAVRARASMDNLIVVAPVAAVIALLCLLLIVGPLLRPRETEAAAAGPDSALWGDVLLLAGFAAFCYALTHIGFDLATFLFVWGGVVMSGGRGWWQPPVFAAVFTALLVYGFGSLFPYPMLTLVL